MNSFADTPIETSASSRAVRGQAALAAKASTPLLLSGPAGSGKSHLAHSLHHSGPRCDQPLIFLDCSLLPGTLFFGEAFGHGSGGLVRGVGAALGSLRAAGAGTVVIENVDHLSPGARQELLRAMRDGLVTPLGTAERVPFSARVIATTRLDIPAIQAAGGREPSLAGLLSQDAALPDCGHIHIAGLSERAEDVESLLVRFVREFAGAGRGLILSPAALEWLRGYEWPENVAELKRLVSHLVESGHERIGRIAVERILTPDLSPWVVDHRVVERTRFPGFGAHRLGRSTTCSAVGSATRASCRKP